MLDCDFSFFHRRPKRTVCDFGGLYVITGIPNITRSNFKRKRGPPGKQRKNYKKKLERKIRKDDKSEEYNV